MRLLRTGFASFLLFAIFSFAAKGDDAGSLMVSGSQQFLRPLLDQLQRDGTPFVAADNQGRCDKQIADIENMISSQAGRIYIVAPCDPSVIAEKLQGLSESGAVGVIFIGTNKVGKTILQNGRPGGLLEIFLDTSVFNPTTDQLATMADTLRTNLSIDKNSGNQLFAIDSLRNQTGAISLSWEKWELQDGDAAVYAGIARSFGDFVFRGGPEEVQTPLGTVNFSSSGTTTVIPTINIDIQKFQNVKSATGKTSQDLINQFFGTVCPECAGATTTCLSECPNDCSSGCNKCGTNDQGFQCTNAGMVLP